jgi:2-methylcitrate dehydratase PrpD
MTVARQLAEFVTRTAATDLPAKALDHAAMLIASTIASAAFGSSIRSACIIRDLAKERGGRAQASVWFDGGGKLPLADAAQVNAVMSDAAACDDSDLRNIVHAGTPLTATTLALAETNGASGEDVLAAIVLGYEAAGRIGAAITPGFRRRGLHGCHAAIFAAAAAAARLRRLDTAQTAQALALAATSIGGLAAAADTSLAREYHAGLATLLGINAVLAAERDYPAEEQIFEARRGFFAVYGDTDPAVAAAVATAGLGESWDILTDMAVKLGPGGHPHHALAEAAAKAARDGNIAAVDIETITLSRPGVDALAGPVHPHDLVSMAHSPAYFLAAGAADRDFSWVHATPEKIADPGIHRLIDRVRVGPPPTENVEHYRQGATVTISTADGRSCTTTVFAPKGAAMLGLEWRDIDAKYRALVPHSGLSPERIETSLVLIRDFRRAPSAAALVELLAPPS